VKREEITEVCDEIYIMAKNIEKLAIDNTDDRNKLEFFVKYLDHLRKDLAIYIDRPEVNVLVPSEENAQINVAIRISVANNTLNQAAYSAQRKRNVGTSSRPNAERKTL